MSLIDILEKPKKRKKQRTLAAKIFDELTSRQVVSGIEYDRGDDEKLCKEIIQRNLDFKNSESLEKFNSMKLKIAQLVTKSDNRGVASESVRELINEVNVLANELGEIIKL